MRLTKFDKTAFVRAVLDDVPYVDYSEQARKLAMKHLISLLPENVRTAYHANPEWIRSNRVRLPNYLQDFYGPALGYVSYDSFPDELKEQLAELSDAAKEQSNTRKTLEDKVTGLINSVTTLKAALKNFPEFAKYFPADRDAADTVNLPAANVIADLTNAGWPKDKK